MKRELAFNHAPSYGVPDKLAVSGGRPKRFVPPMRARLFRADGRLTDYSRCGATNLNGNCTICFTFRPPDSAGWNRHLGSVRSSDCANSWFDDSSTLKLLMSARPSVSTTNCTSTLPSTRELSSSDGYPGIGLPSRAMTGLSTCDANIGSPESD